MSKFQQSLRVALKLPPFSGTLRKFAAHTGIDVSQLHRALGGTQRPTPELVGRLCGTLKPKVAAILLHSYLEDIADTTLATTRPSTLKGENWAEPSKRFKVSIECSELAA